MRLHRLGGKIALFCALVGRLGASHFDFVTVSATASPNFIRQRLVNGRPRPETYVFLKGKFFAGETRDPSIERFDFKDLAAALVPNLAAQEFHPAADPKSADLLIVVSWGTTQEVYANSPADPQTQFEWDQFNQDLTQFRDALAGTPDLPTAPGDSVTSTMLPPNLVADQQILRAEGTSALSSGQANAQLLGYQRQLARDAKISSLMPTISAEEETHSADLVEERYFVILLAYDYQALRKSRQAKPDAAHPPPRPQPLWEVRMNVRAAGNNFTQALPAMARVSASYFGNDNDGLATERTDLNQTGRVEVGPAKVVGVVK